MGECTKRANPGSMSFCVKAILGQLYEHDGADIDSSEQANPLGKYIASPIPRHFKRAHPVDDFVSQVHNLRITIPLTEHI